MSDRLRTVRRSIVIVIIASLSVTALIGIVTLLFDDFGEVQAKVMLTTLVIGVYSIVLLCDLAVAGRRFQWAGYLGIVVSTVALVSCLVLVWGDYAGDDSEWIWKTFWLSLITGVSLAQANLLLLLGERKRQAVRIGLWLTVALIALNAALFWWLILSDGRVGSDAYGRLIGTVAILDVLGTIVVPVISKFLRDEHVAPGGIESDLSAGMLVRLPAELSARLTMLAAERNTSAEALVIEALDDLTAAR